MSSESTGTVRLHRVLRAPPERVYRAFLDAAALVKWLPPHGFTATMHEFDGRVGGGYRMSFTNLGTGSSHSFTVKYVELVPDRRIRHTDTFDAPRLPGEMQVTVDFEESIAGTVLRIVQEGIPAAIPVDFCYQGWQESLVLLAQLVEPEIPDGP
ncbi:MAG: SRPBCC family protein [Luteimonas sp.]|nr:SRPBCC family protein [Luteimonas sp.]